MSDHEHVFNHRTGATRAIVTACDDTGLVQIVDAQSHDGVTRSGVEVLQVFGLASVVPGNGATVVLIANGGDPSDMIALMAANNWARLGGLQPGETAIYGVDGSRIHIKIGGHVEILAAASVDITAPDCTVTCSGSITLAGDVHVTGTLSVGGATSIDGNLAVTGNITATGSITEDV